MKKQSVKSNSNDTPTAIGWLWEFSKKIIVVITFGYILITFFELSIIAIKFDQIDDVGTLLASIFDKTCDVFCVCVGGYFLKAMSENVTKISASGKLLKKKVSDMFNNTKSDDSDVTMSSISNSTESEDEVDV